MNIVGCVLFAFAILAAGSPPAAGRPSTFTGWIGQFTIEARGEPTRVSLGESIHYTLQISGMGEAGKRPDLAGVPAFSDRFDLVVDERADSTAEKSSWTFHYRLSPKTVETSSIPPLRWSYYDGVARRYQTILAHSIPIKVDPAPLATTENVPADENRSSRTRYAILIALGLFGLAALVLLLSKIDWSPQSGVEARIESISPEASHDPGVSNPSIWSPNRFSGDDVIRLGREFQSFVAERCGLAVESATVEEILAAANGTFSIEDARELKQLLTEIDRIRFGKEKEGTDDLAGRIQCWADRISQLSSDPDVAQPRPDT